MIEQLLSTLERWAWERPPQGWAKQLTLAFRVLLTVVRGLHEDRLWLHAGYMTYLSLLNLVPIGALALAVSSRLGWQSALMRWVENSLSPTAPELAARLVEAMDRLDLVALGYAGLGAIIIAGVLSVSQLEKDLAAIWNTPARSRLWQRLLLYPSALVLIPTVVALILAFGTIAEARATLWIRGLAGWGELGQWLYRALTNLPLLFRVIPFLLSWSTLTIVYWLGTSTPVRPRAAILGGLVGSIIWQVAQNTYINFQFATSTFREIWGYLAQIPLLLLWIYVSWVTVYVGAEFAFAWQYRRAYLPKLPMPRVPAPIDEGNAVVSVASETLRSLATPARSITIAGISSRRRIPLCLVTHVAKRLVGTGILKERRIGREWVLECSKDLGDLTVGDLIARYRQTGSGAMSARDPQSEVRPEMTIAAIAGIRSDGPC